MNFIELLQSFDFVTILIILLVSIPSIVSCISWCKKLWKAREAFKKENMREGIRVYQEEEAEEQRFMSGEYRIAQLELLVAQQAQMLDNLQKITQRLEKSDKLAIKTYIKEQHDIWVPKNCIDGQVLELLEDRYKIYREEGGNSWAERLMRDLRSLPIIALVPMQDSHDQH